MNILPSPILNEPLKKFLPICHSLSPQDMAKALKSPYLTYESTDKDKGFTPEEMEAAGLVDEYGLIKTPFPKFRFCCQATSGFRILGYVERRKTSLFLCTYSRDLSKKLQNFFGSISYYGFTSQKGTDGGKLWDANDLEDISLRIKAGHDVDTKEFKEIKDKFEEEQKTGKSTLTKREVLILKRGLKTSIDENSKRSANLSHLADWWKNGMSKILPENAPESPFEMQGNMPVALYQMLMLICYEYIVPHNFIAKVSKDTEGKSVEWKEAREHLVVIHRRHPANNATLKEGQEVSDEKQIYRIAHSRRAHTRVLRSSKFKYKQGRTVFVRASWVGPKQWKDTAGQTYQILTPINPLEMAA